MFLHTATGGMLSATVTVDVHSSQSPCASVARSVTVFGPILVQSNVLGVAVKVREQLSVEPKSMSLPKMVLCPVASRFIEIFLQTATGVMSSTTVTTASSESKFPFTSVTVRVTLFVPTLVQSKEVLLAITDWIPQLSVEPSFMSEACIVACPSPSSVTLIFLTITIGSRLSITVTVALQVLVLPCTSVTVSVTVLSPVSVQVK